MYATIPLTKRLNILAVLADDEPYSAGLFSALRGHFVLICQSADEAVQMAVDFAPDVVLADLWLPHTESLADRIPEVTGNRDVTLIAIRSAHAASPVGFHSQLNLSENVEVLEAVLDGLCQAEDVDPSLTRTPA